MNTNSGKWQAILVLVCLCVPFFSFAKSLTENNDGKFLVALATSPSSDRIATVGRVGSTVGSTENITVYSWPAGARLQSSVLVRKILQGGAANAGS